MLPRSLALHLSVQPRSPALHPVVPVLGVGGDVLGVAAVILGVIRLGLACDIYL